MSRITPSSDHSAFGNPIYPMMIPKLPNLEKLRNALNNSSENATKSCGCRTQVEKFQQQLQSKHIQYLCELHGGVLPFRGSDEESRKIWSEQSSRQ